MKQIVLFSLLLTLLVSFSGNKKVNIWLIGDSTMAQKKPEREPESGWGEEFKLFVNDNALVHNQAASGRSTKSFIKEKRWQNVYDSIKTGDYVIIQFGHNDKKPDSLLHTDAFTTYKQNLKMFIDQARSKGANPILCSSIVRRHFDGKGNLMDSHGDYIKASREIAQETNTPFVDLEASSRKLVSELGAEKSKAIYVFCKPGECPRRKKGVQDSTHLNHEGARKIAELFTNEIKKQKNPFVQLLK